MHRVILPQGWHAGVKLAGRYELGEIVSASVSCQLKFCQFVSLNFNLNLTRLTNPGDDL